MKNYSLISSTTHFTSSEIFTIKPRTSPICSNGSQGVSFECWCIVFCIQGDAQHTPFDECCCASKSKLGHCCRSKRMTFARK